MDEQDLTTTQIVSERIARIAKRKIWLPALIYECLPYFYILAGFTALFATLYINDWYWMVPHWLLFTALCVHAGAKIVSRRITFRRAKRADSDDSNNHKQNLAH